MMRPLCKILILVYLGAGLNACEPQCVNKVIDSKIAPVGDKQAVLYVRNCGATTGSTTHVSILNRDSQVRGTGNVLVVKDPASMGETASTTRVRWVAADTLEISLLGGRAIQSQADSVDGVIIRVTTHSAHNRR
jgi:hypothetical protein